MREIKFRVWDTQEEKYLYPEKQGFIIVPTRPSFGVTLPYENTHNPNNIDEDCFDWADADLLMGRYRLEQYTGLKDKNGKEMYERDIVKRAEDGGFDIVGVVEWSEKAARFWVDRYYYPGGGKWEVIGNIHENKELLDE